MASNINIGQLSLKANHNYQSVQHFILKWFIFIVHSLFVINAPLFCMDSLNEKKKLIYMEPPLSNPLLPPSPPVTMIQTMHAVEWLEPGGTNF